MIEDKRRWRRAYVRLYTDPDFQGLSDAEKVMATYLLFGPQTNRIGLYHVSAGLGIEHLRCPLRQFRMRLERVCEVFRWQYDAAAHVIWIPSWWDYNPVTGNENNIKGALSDIVDVPPTPLIDRFAKHLVFVPPNLHKYFQFIADRYQKRTVSGQCSNGVATSGEKEKETETAGTGKNGSAEASSAPSDDSPVVLTFPTVGPVATWALTEAQIAKWQGVYPALDVLGECRIAWGWCDANPSKRKTARGMLAFLNRWLARTVDSVRGHQMARPVVAGSRVEHVLKHSQGDKYLVPDDEPLV